MAGNGFIHGHRYVVFFGPISTWCAQSWEPGLFIARRKEEVAHSSTGDNFGPCSWT